QHEPRTLPGALHFPLDELEERFAQLPTDREVILFCNCPHEATSAHIAHRLKNRGIQRVRPLAGGLDGWLQRGFPLSAPSTPETSDLP
ncbi:MAG: rhodanese-like domain-containing protein, partial [bacterium]